MRTRLLAALAATLLLVGFGSSSAQALPFTGSITLLLGTLPPVTVPGAGTGDPTLPSISAGAFSGSGSSPVTGVPPITQIFFSIAGNASGTVSSGPTVSGTLQARGFGIGAALAGAPLGGQLGFSTATVAVHSAASATVTAHFGAWTSGVATIVRSHTGMSAACTPGVDPCPTGMASGSVVPSPNPGTGGGARITLVAPVDLWSSLASGIPTFTVMELNYVPEPAEMLLLGSGALAMLVLGWRRPRR